MLREHLIRVGHDLGIESKEFNTERPGVYRFRVNSDLSVEISEDDYGLFFQAHLSPTPNRNREELYTSFMNANVFGQGTYGNVLGISEDLKFVTLSRFLKADPSFEEFRDILEDYVNAALFWRKKALEYS